MLRVQADTTYVSRRVVDRFGYMIAWLHFHGLTSYEQLNSFGAKRQKKLDPGFDSQG